MKNSSRAKIVKAKVKKKKKVKITNKNFNAQEKKLHVRWNFKTGELVKARILEEERIVLIIDYNNTNPSFPVFYVLSGNRLITIAGSRLRKI